MVSLSGFGHEAHAASGQESGKRGFESRFHSGGTSGSDITGSGAGPPDLDNPVEIHLVLEVQVKVK